MVIGDVISSGCDVIDHVVDVRVMSLDCGWLLKWWLMMMMMIMP